MAETDKIKIEISSPTPCLECKKHRREGYMLAYLRARFKDEAMYNPKPTEFSHYEAYYQCSNELCGHTVEGQR